MKRIWKVLTGVVMGVLLVGAMWQPDITTAAPVGNAAVLHVDIASVAGAILLVGRSR